MGDFWYNDGEAHMKHWDEMLERLEPEKIILYGNSKQNTKFKGNIVIKKLISSKVSL